MKVHVLLFGSLAERCAFSHRDLDVAAGARAADVLDLLSREQTEFKEVLARSALAVNREYVPAGHALHEGDEVAFMPPVSGG